MTMRTIHAAAAALAALLVGAAASAGVLPNGWTVTPSGPLTSLGTLPLHMALDPTGRWIAVTASGYATQSVVIVDARSGRVVASRVLEGTFYGVAFSPDGDRLYVSTAAGSGVRAFAFDAANGGLGDATTWRLAPGNAWIAGLAVSPDGLTLYAAGNLTRKIYAVDAKTGTVRWAAPAGVQPYAVVASLDGRRVFATDWVGGVVVVLRASDGAVLATIRTDAHPNAMALSRDGAMLYVACASGDAVDVIDTGALARSKTLRATLWPGAIAEGTTPDGLALSPDGRMLFVADADDDAVVAIDLRSSAGLAGAVPVGWYATDVAVSRDGRTLFALDGKGVSGHANASYQHSDVAAVATDRGYVAALATGDLERIPMPAPSALASGLARARADSPYRPWLRPGIAANAKVVTSAVRHVIYVIKENRTYDEVLGDDPRGDGDPRLAEFGRRTTPNIHRLADDFVLLDDFDVDSEVSADGHNWATAAYATDYVQKLWPSDYSDRGRDYDFQGGGGSSPAGGYIWDAASRVSFRDYGEFISPGPPPQPPEVASIGGRYDRRYPGWSLKISDQTRVDEWMREFRGFERDGKLPALEIVYLPDDHTAATRPGYRTPYAMIASNDYALGRLVDALSHSRYWSDTVVFVVEDDAQAGPDHVSDQRAEALIAGGPVRRGVVDHTHYTQSSVLHTIELLLGLKPMSQFDAGATDMLGLLLPRADARPWSALKPAIDIDAVNLPGAPQAKTSMRLDLSRPDASDAALLEGILRAYARAQTGDAARSTRVDL